MLFPSLPHEVEDAGWRIRSMEVRGVTRIAQKAVQSLRPTAVKSSARDTVELVSEMDHAAKYLLSTRPTTVSLPNSVRYVMYGAFNAQRQGVPLEEARGLILATCKAFLVNAKEATARIAEIGARRINDGDIVLTHCHSNAVVSILKRRRTKARGSRSMRPRRGRSAKAG